MAHPLRNGRGSPEQCDAWGTLRYVTVWPGKLRLICYATVVVGGLEMGRKGRLLGGEELTRRLGCASLCVAHPNLK